MSQNSPKPIAIIFGASQSGTSAFEKLKSSHDVVAFSDNAKDKAGTTLCGLPVIAPDLIPTQIYDTVFIASEFFEQIHRQLIQDVGVPEEKVAVLPTSVIKPLSLGDEGMTQIAEQILFKACQSLQAHDVPFHVDAGTLLGIYRDGGLIPWDDDLDIAVSSEFISQAQLALTSVLPDLAEQTGEAWEAQLLYANQSFGAVTQGAVRGIKLKCKCSDTKLPMLDIFFKYIQGEVMDYVLSSRGITMPSYHLKSVVLHEFKGEKVPLPSDVEQYLERHYGDWKTPVKDWHLGMLKNATVFE